MISRTRTRTDELLLVILGHDDAPNLDALISDYSAAMMVAWLAAPSLSGWDGIVGAFSVPIPGESVRGALPSCLASARGV